MDPTEEQPQRSDSQTPLPRSRPDSFTVPVQRRPPLSRGSAPQPLARQPVSPNPESVTNPEPIAVQPEPIQHQQPAIAPQPVNTPEPAPVMQMPQPASFAPPDLPQQQPAPVAEQPPTVARPPEPVSQQQPMSRLDFTPPPQKNKRRWMYPAMAAAVVIVMSLGIFSYAKVMAAKNNPDTVMRDALSNSLSLTTLEGTTKSQDTNIITKYDFTNSKNPIVSTESSLTSPKGKATINGYGNIKDTYINYANLPKSVPANISKQMSSSWIQVRQNGELPKDVPDYVVKASDPRYQVFGPIVMSNLEGKTKDQLLDFMIKNKVYGYDAAKVKKEALGDETMFVFPIKLDVSFLKVASQSAALAMGLEPAQIQLATDTMESLRDANVTLYVKAGDNTFARMYISKDGATKTIDLSGYKETKLPDAPQTKLLWEGFTPIQNQIEAQAALTKTQY